MVLSCIDTNTIVLAMVMMMTMMTTMMTMMMTMMMMMMTTTMVKREWKKVGGRRGSCSLHYWQTWGSSYSTNFYKF